MHSTFRITILLLLLFVLAGQPVFAATTPDLTGQYVILIDQQTGQTLFEKQADDPWYPASTTKILTALIILENHTLDEIVTVDGESPFVDGSKIFIFEGEQLTVEQLLNAMLIASANDCAEALARFHSGSLEAFAEAMNLRAQQLGATHSHFVNPHGLHDPEHYTTARDLARIARAAYALPAFRDIVSKKTYSIPPTEFQPETRYMSSTNPFINGDGRQLYDGKYVPEIYDIVDGIKTGYTTASHHNLVATAQQGGDRLITVVMDSDNSGVYVDTRHLLDYGFSSYQFHTFTFAGNRITQVPIEGGTISDLDLFARDSISAMVPVDMDLESAEPVITLDDVTLPITEGQVLGTLAYVSNGTTIGSTPLIAGEDVAVLTWQMRMKDLLIDRDGLGRLNLKYYMDIGVNLLVTLLVWRTLVTAYRIFRRRRKKGLTRIK